MGKINTQLNKVALRYRGIHVDITRDDLKSATYQPSVHLFAMVRRLQENGYTFSEEVMHALSMVSTKDLLSITDTINSAYGVDLNWVPLVKNWETSTDSSLWNNIVTMFVNSTILKDIVDGVTLPCGHLIPKGTFNLENYNGCPFCGAQFRTSNEIFKGQGGKLRELVLYTTEDLNDIYVKLLTSTVPLDATQFDSLKILLDVFEISEDIEVQMRESCMAVIDAYVNKGQDQGAEKYLKSPNDILRYLWYKKIGKAIIIQPKTLIKLAHVWKGILPQGPYRTNEDTVKAMEQHLKLKYSREDCRRVARWLNNMKSDTRAMAELMHPYREMWARFIRALRLAEYSKKPGYGHLKELMDVFYRQDYVVWNGELDKAVTRNDSERTFALLKSRPGLFARCLFATMMRFGTENTLKAFREVAPIVPARLLLSLMNASEHYFNVDNLRYVTSSTGKKTKIEHNPLLFLYSQKERENMVDSIKRMFMDVMGDRYKLLKQDTGSIYIDPLLYDIPIGVGDRSTTIQDASCALQGTRFHVDGDKVRLFLQWGAGLPAQHMDMDLSARIYYDDKTCVCYYCNLVTTGAKHSGDIRSIPDDVGTAEYVELDMQQLRNAGARYVAFICNAYSDGAIPCVQVGWMNSSYPMAVSEETGVAYDPSCVQHMVRVSEDNLAKSITFGVLDVVNGEITWLELLGQEQAAILGDPKAVLAYLNRLRNKVSIGQLLELKAQAQGVSVIDDIENADSKYTYEWALNPENIVAELLINELK